MFAAANRVLRSTGRIVVKCDGDGASVSYDADVRLRGPLRLLDSLMRPGLYAVADRVGPGLTRALSAANAPRRTPSS